MPEVEYRQVDNLSIDDYFMVNKGGKWGVAGANGRLQSSMTYDDVYSYQDNCLIAKRDGKWGIWDKNEKVLVPNLYKSANFRNRWYLELGVDKNKNDVFLTTAKKMVLKNAVFHDDIDVRVWEQEELKRYNYFFYQVDGRKSCLNQYGEIIVPPVHDVLYQYKNHDNVYIFEENGKKGAYLFGKSVTKISPLYDFLIFNDYWLYVNIGGMDKIAYQKATGKSISVSQDWVGGVWQIIDLNGKPLCQPIRCDYISGLTDTSVIYGKDCKFGLMSRDGRELLPPIHDQIFRVGGARLIIERAEGYQLTDELGRPVSKIYKEIKSDGFENRFVIISEKGYGVMDAMGREIVAPVYGYAKIKDISYSKEIKYSRIFIFLDNDSASAIADAKGNVLTPFIIEDYESDMFADSTFILEMIDGKYALFDAPSLRILPERYDHIIDYKMIGNYHIVKKNGKAGLAHKSGAFIPVNWEKDVILSPRLFQYEKVNQYAVSDNRLFRLNDKCRFEKPKFSYYRDEVKEMKYNSRLLIMKTDSGRKAIFNRRFEQVFPQKFVSISRLTKNTLEIEFGEEKSMLADTFLHYLSPDTFQTIYNFSDFFMPDGKKEVRVFVVKRNENCGLIDEKGRYWLPCVYDYLRIYNAGTKEAKTNIIIARYKDRETFLDADLRPLVPDTFTSVEYSERNEHRFFKAKRGDSLFVVDALYRKVWHVKYQDSQTFSEGLMVVNEGRERAECAYTPGLFGAVDTAGREVIPVTLNYDAVGNFDQGVSVVEKWEKKGLIDRTGRELIPPVYFDLRAISDPNKKVYYVAETDSGKCGLYDPQQKKWLFQPKPFYIDEFSGRLLLIYPLAKDMRSFLALKEKSDRAYSLIDKKGLANLAGQIVAPISFEKINLSKVFQGYYITVDKEFMYYREGLLDLNGKVLQEPDLHFPNEFGFDYNSENNGARVIPFERNDKWGFLNRSGQVAVAPRYVSVRFDKYLSKIDYFIAEEKTSDGKDTLLVVLDSLGRVLRRLPKEVDQADFVDLPKTEQTPEGIGLRIEINKKTGLTTLGGKSLLPPIYSSVETESMCEGYLIKAFIDDTLFVFDKQFKPLPRGNGVYSHFGYQTIWIKTGEGYRLYDANMQPISDHIFNLTLTESHLTSCDLPYFLFETGYQLVDENNRPLFPYLFENIEKPVYDKYRR